MNHYERRIFFRDTAAAVNKLKPTWRRLISHSLKFQNLFTSLGGRIEVDRLSEKDKVALSLFYKKYLKKKLENGDRTDETFANNFGNKLKAIVTRYKTQTKLI